MNKLSKFSHQYGILFAADLESEDEAFRCLDQIADEIDAIKLGNSLLYQAGASLVEKLKTCYSLPVIADIKLTDVSHIATKVANLYALHGADAVVLSGICGAEVFRDVRNTLPVSCEPWVFTEFTHNTGLIDESLADKTVKLALETGIVGFQVPGTRTYRIEDVRDDIGENPVIIACGIGTQGGRFGSAILAGANFEIIGRSIYGQSSPKASAKEAKDVIQDARETYLKRREIV